jgi:hypothetical protein
LSRCNAGATRTRRELQAGRRHSNGSSSFRFVRCHSTPNAPVSLPRCWRFDLPARER